jgi:phosphatidylinositol alpha-mannosyltransferase
MKVLLVSDAYYPYPSGVTEYVSNIAKYLKSSGHNVDILTLHYDNEVSEDGIIRVAYCKLFDLNGTRVTLPWSMHISSEVKRVMDKGEYDIVHLCGPFFPNISHFALKYSRFPNVATFLSVSSSIFKPVSYMYNIPFSHYNSKIDVRIGISRVAIDFIKPFFPGEYKLIPIGVDTERFNPDLNTYKPMKRKDKKLKILFLGRLDERKGLDILLKALSRLDKDIDYFLYIAGTSMKSKKYEIMAKEYKIPVKFLGFVSNKDIGKIFASADIYCSPAKRGETYGIVLIEAMASGTPIIASNISGYSTVIKNNYNGILSKPNPESFKEAIEKLAADKALQYRLKVNGISYSKLIDWKKIIKKIEKEYENAIIIARKRL